MRWCCGLLNFVGPSLVSKDVFRLVCWLILGWELALNMLYRKGQHLRGSGRDAKEVVSLRETSMLSAVGYCFGICSLADAH
jgi:hypothetical protein